MRRASIILLVLLIPFASAGTASDPEIRDNAGDVEASVSIVPVPLPDGIGPPPEALDIVASWFHDETPESISVTMQVSDLSDVDAWDDPSFGFIRWGTRFELTNYVASSKDYWENTWVITVNLNNGPTGWRASLQPPDYDGEPQTRRPASYTIDRDAGTLTVTVDRDDLGRPMAGDAMTETLSLHDASWGTSPVALNYVDQAPDGTYPSRDFVFGLDTATNASVEEPPMTAPEPNPPSVTPEENPSPTAPDQDAPSDAPKQKTPFSIAPILLAIAFAAQRRRSITAER